MNKSYYFSDLAAAYDAEIQDLLSDSEGKRALEARLAHKRRELKAILPMIEYSPEMVAPVFYDGFYFTDTRGMAALLRCEPDDDDFPQWEQVAAMLSIESWARPYLDAVLAERAGPDFMVAAAGMEFIRKFDRVADLGGDADADGDGEMPDEDRDDDDEGVDRDLAEAGDGWLGEQGFDSLKA